MADPQAHGDKSPSVEPEERRTEGEGERTVYAPGEQATYDPSDTEVTRGRMQGLGMGQRDLSVQDDPTGSATAREFRDRTGTSTTDDMSVRPAKSDDRSGG